MRSRQELRLLRGTLNKIAGALMANSDPQITLDAIFRIVDRTGRMTGIVTLEAIPPVGEEDQK